MPQTVVLLHGFAGTGRAWDAVVELLDGERYTAVAPDIRGHGAAATARPITFEGCAADVLAAAPQRFDLCGYSMGGRVALHVALAAPERVNRLVLVSATAGIDDPDQREARRRADGELAARILQGSIGAFAERWLAQPLFAADDAAATAAARADILRNDPAALAAVLRGIGTGEMKPVWDRLGELGSVETVVVAGERDGKFVALGERLATGLRGAMLEVVPGCGHAVPRAAPEALAAIIEGRVTRR